MTANFGTQLRVDGFQDLDAETGMLIEGGVVPAAGVIIWGVVVYATTQIIENWNGVIQGFADGWVGAPYEVKP
jgi:hypothetical protein